jgi:rubrerythrin
MSKKIDKYIDEVVENIRKDREVTNDLLKDAIGYLAKDESRHRDIGLVLSKYVETLQRSNEQLVKITSLIAKEESKSDGLTDKDMEEIFAAIKGED